MGSEFLMKGQSGAAKGVFGKKVNTGKKLSHGLGRSGKSRAVRGKSAICTLKECDEKADTCYIRQVKNIELSFSLIVSAQPRLSQTPCVNLTVCPSLLTQVIQVSPSAGRTEEFSGVVPGLRTKEHPSEICRSLISCSLFIIITTITIYLVVLGNLKLLQASNKSVRNVFPSIKVLLARRSVIYIT